MTAARRIGRRLAGCTPLLFVYGLAVVAFDRNLDADRSCR